MPQPIRNPAAFGAIRYGTATMFQRPEHAVRGMAVIGIWAQIEEIILMVNLSLVGGPKSEGAMIFLELTTKSAKSSVMNKIVEMKLSKRMQEDYRRLEKVSKQVEKDRNKLSHNTWGHSEKMPEVVVLSDRVASEKSTMKFFLGYRVSKHGRFSQDCLCRLSHV